MRDWEASYRSGDTPWDKGGAAPPLLEMLERHGPGLWDGGPVVVPGCGFGHDVRVLAENGIPACGVDIAKTAVESARVLPAVASETYECGDFLDAEWWGARSFAGMWEHTCLCAIDPALRPQYAESAGGLLVDGGVLAGVFYLNPDNSAEEGPPFGISVEELDVLFSPWFERVDGWVPESSYASRVGREWIGIYRKLAKPRVAGSMGCG